MKKKYTVSDILERKVVSTINEDLKPSLCELSDEEIVSIKLVKNDVVTVIRLFNEEYRNKEIEQMHNVLISKFMGGMR